MRDYEVVYIFKSALGTEDIDARLQRYHEKILAAEGSEITAVEHWGKRQLAYPIDRNENGYYVVAQFSTEPGALPEFERLLKLDEEVLRHLVVLSEGELAVPISLGDDDEDDDRRRKGRDDDDDEPRRGRDDDDDDDGDDDDGDDAAADATDADAADEVDAAADATDADIADGEDADDSGAESDEDTDEEDKD
ncbi:MAG: 30S ribosomal protein S6 [Gemmatimonadetes bacterium]|nr:30S ribosomal protein S6 [Gemmatimonadota bacterium]